MRILDLAAFAALGITSAQAESLTDISQFAQSICGENPEGTLTRTTIQGKVAANAGLLAKILSGDANVSVQRTEEIYKGIPFGKLSASIPTASMCKQELAKLLISQRDSAPMPNVV